MGMFGRLVGWFQDRGGVPPMAPAQGAPDPVRAMGAAALARGNHAEAERFDPRDDDKWPLPPRQDLQRAEIDFKEKLLDARMEHRHSGMLMSEEQRGAMREMVERDPDIAPEDKKDLVAQLYRHAPPQQPALERERVELEGVSARVAALHAALSEGDRLYGDADKAEAALMALHEDRELREALEARGMTLGDGGDFTGGSYADMADRMTLNFLERAASDAARGVIREEADAEAEYLEVVDDRDGWRHPVGEATRDAPTPTIDAIVQRGLERRIAAVPELPTAELLSQANAFRTEAAVEGGWDNYSTAESLRSAADRYRLAAAVRDPEAPQAPVAQAREAITLRLHDRAADVRDDQDVGEATRFARMAADHALGELGREEMAAVVDELEATGRLHQETAAELKTWHLERQAERDEDEHEL